VDDRSPLYAELDRLGASFRKAGARDYISVKPGLDEVKLLDPQREHPRRSWLGPEQQALELLDAVPDDAGVHEVWRVLAALRLLWDDRALARYAYNVREGSRDGPDLGKYQHSGPNEPEVGTFIYLEENQGGWRVTDLQRSDTAERDEGNLLIVERVG
jgi:hypothetical protein